MPLPTNSVLKYPFGPATEYAPAQAASIAVATDGNDLGIINVAGALAQNSTLNLTISPETKKGASLHVNFSTTATETLALGTGCDGVTITGVAGKIKTAFLIFTGTVYELVNSQLN